MERNEFLITQIRENTNLTDRNGVKDATVLMHLNAGQRTIQSLIHQAELQPDLFLGTVQITHGGEDSTALPNDVYLKNHILSVKPDEESRRSLDKIQLNEIGKKQGYWVTDKEIGFTLALKNRYPTFNLVYFRELPVLDIRRGLVTAKGANSITVSGYSTTVLIGSSSDWICVVDKDGVIIQAEIRIVSFNSGTGVITTDTAISADVVANHYVVVGRFASSHCQLPDACEPFLLDFAQKKMRSKNTSKETVNQSLFSEEQKEILIGMFQGNSAAPLYPPITDTDWP